MDKRKKYILELRKKRMTWQEIGVLLSISRQRAHQIGTGYKSPFRTKPAIDHKILTEKKLQAFGFETHGENPSKNGISGGKDYVREWVRIRDRHTCQICLKKWKKGTRRFDVHHLDEERESLDKIRGRGSAYIIKWDKEHMDRMVTLCHKCHLNLDRVKESMRRGQEKFIHKKLGLGI